MSSKVFFLLAVVQSAISQYIPGAIGTPGFGAPFGSPCNGLAAPVLGLNGLAGRGLYPDGFAGISSNLEFTPTSSGGLTVKSASVLPPTGISIISENAFEGALSVAGELPFVGTTAVEGEMPSVGAGAINHSCGNGVTAMEAEGAAVVAPIAAAIAPTAATFAATSPLTAARFAPTVGLGVPNRFGFPGCGNIV